MSEAYLYGENAAGQPGTEGLNAFFLLVDKPEAYNLPPNPIVPTKHAKDPWTSFAFAALGLIAVAIGSAFAGSRS
jgi:formate dehydrogenase iron-sulfur subunit